MSGFFYEKWQCKNPKAEPSSFRVVQKDRHPVSAFRSGSAEAGLIRDLLFLITEEDAGSESGMTVSMMNHLIAQPFWTALSFAFFFTATH